MNQSQSMAGLASLVQSRGRNGDTMLVHMTPGEVKGLQALALAHGGSLTVNPDTGLVEANFLKKLLPTLLGVGLNFLVPGLGALGSGLLVGGVEAARTGDIGKGLMAGLGAYGGAGLGSSLAGIGAASKDAATKMLTQEAVAGAGKDAAAKIAQETAANQVKQQMANQAATNVGTLGQRFSNLSSGLSNMGAGLKEVATGGQGLGLSGFGGVKTLANVMPGGVGGLAATGMNVANAMTPDYKMPTGGDMEVDQSYYEGADYDPITGTFRQGQWRQGYPGFPGGMAAGGVIPAPNGNYPLAKPTQALGAYESDIDTYTGEERFAAGGPAFTRRRYEEMPIDPALAQPNSAKAGWMQYMQQNPAEQQRFIDAGYPPEFFQQNPETFTGNRPFVPGKDEAVRASEQARLAQQGIASPSAMPQYQSAPQSADAFSSYLQNLNQYITSPVAPPAPPKAAPAAGGASTTGGSYYGGDGAMRWDSSQGRFVSAAPQTPFSAGNMPTGNPFSGFGNIDFSAIQNYFRNAGQNPAANRSISNTGAMPPSAGRPGGQNQYGGDVSDMPFIDQGDTGMVPPDQGFGTAQPDQSGAVTPDFSGMDFSNLDLSGLQNINMSGIGGSSYAPPEPSYMPFEPQSVQSNTFDYTPEPSYTPPEYQAQEPLYAQPMPEQQMYAPETPIYSAMQPELAPRPAFDYTPEPSYTPPEQSYMPIPEFGQGPAMTYGEAMMANNPAPQPAPDMSGLAGLANYGNYQQPAFDYGAMMAQQPASQPAFDYGSMMAQQPSFDMGGFGGFDYNAAPQAIPQMTQAAPDMSGFSGGFNDMGMFAGGGSVQYAAAGKLLRGPGDGMSDSIKANISGRQEARLADGEFVVPADVVSHLGNGSTEAGSRKLYKMMADVRRARTGKRKQAPAIKAGKYIPS